MIKLNVNKDNLGITWEKPLCMRCIFCVHKTGDVRLYRKNITEYTCFVQKKDNDKKFIGHAIDGILYVRGLKVDPETFCDCGCPLYTDNNDKLQTEEK